MTEELKVHIGTLIKNITDFKNSESKTLQSHVQSPVEEIPKLASLINAHATKLGLVYKPPVKESSANACRSETDLFCKNVVLLSSIINQLRKETEKYSLVFVNELAFEFNSIVEAAIILLSELVKLLDLETDDGAQRLVGVGLVWESTDAIVKTVKGGNSGVLRNKLKSSNKVIIDALDELKEWLENPVEGGDENYDMDELLGIDKVPTDLNDDDDSNDEDADDELASEEVIECAKKWERKVSLLKLLVGLLNKSIPDYKYTTKFSKSLDAIDNNRKNLNEYVDDVIASLVYDSDVDSAEKAGALLDKEAKGLVEIVKKINDEKKIKWVDSWVIKYNEN